MTLSEMFGPLCEPLELCERVPGDAGGAMTGIQVVEQSNAQRGSRATRRLVRSIPVRSRVGFRSIDARSAREGALQDAGVDRRRSRDRVSIPVVSLVRARLCEAAGLDSGGRTAKNGRRWIVEVIEITRAMASGRRPDREFGRKETPDARDPSPPPARLLQEFCHRRRPIPGDMRCASRKPSGASSCRWARPWSTRSKRA